MAKIKVIKRFRDKTNHSRYFTPDEVVDFDVERAKDVISRGLAVAVEDKPAVDDAEAKKAAAIAKAEKKVLTATEKVNTAKQKADEAKNAQQGLTDEKEIEKAKKAADKAADALAKAEEALAAAQKELDELKGDEE